MVARFYRNVHEQARAEPRIIYCASAQAGQPEKAEKLSQEVTKISTSSETYYNYASFLQGQGRTDEAREWAQKILDKRATMPGYQKRRERAWFRKAYGLLARLRL